MAAFGGVAAAIVGFATMAIVGTASSVNARRLLESVLPTVLMFLSIPIGEADVEQWWYIVVYYAVLFGGTVSGGVFVSVIMMLFYAVSGLIRVADDSAASELVVDE